MDVVRQMSAIAAVFALLGALLWMLRRRGFAALRGAQTKKRSLQSVERLALSPTHALHLVRIQGREVVVATHPQGYALLMERFDGDSN